MPSDRLPSTCPALKRLDPWELPVWSSYRTELGTSGCSKYELLWHDPNVLLQTVAGSSTGKHTRFQEVTRLLRSKQAQPVRLTHLGLSEDSVPMLAIILAPWTSRGGKEKSEEQTPTTWTRAPAAAPSIPSAGEACHMLNSCPLLRHLENVPSRPEGNTVSLPEAHWECNLSVKQNYTLWVTCVWNIVFRNSSWFWVV